MKFTTLSLPFLGVVTAILPMATADWSFWTETCCDGASSGGDCFSNGAVTTPELGVCGGNAAPSGSWSIDKSFSVANVCNTAEILNYRPAGQNTLNVYVGGGTDVVGTCATSNPDTGSCQYGISACLAVKSILCTSTYCT
jgi:hypothetical protein